MKRFLATLLLAIATGCDSGDDSWAHYQAQHIYNGGSPSVSPDQSSVVFSSPTSGPGDIYRVAREGSTRLTRSEEFEAQPCYSPSGDKIAYVRETGGWRHIWIMSADGSNQTQLTTGRALDDLVSFSADGRRIEFTRAMPSSGLGREAVSYSIDSDGSNLHEHSPGLYRARNDEFVSADGSRLIVFGPYASSRIRVLNSKTRVEVESLEIPAGLISRPALSYDGGTITFSLLEEGGRDVSVFVIRRDRMRPEKLR